jgi:NAD(P)-dependent dehydrogenase (short-subunit alcohol dehydrogenase family)
LPSSLVSDREPERPEEGHAVGLLSRRAESSSPVAEEIIAGGGRALAVPADVTNRQSVLSAVAQIRKNLGPITALAHNASGYGRGTILELDPNQVRQSFEANVMGGVRRRRYAGEPATRRWR